MTFVPPNGTVATPDRALDKAALYANARRAAAGFRALGLGPGSAVAMVLRNDIPFLETVLAANWAGAYIVPVNWHLRGGEVGAILADCGADVLVVHTDLLAEIRPFVPTASAFSPSSRRRPRSRPTGSPTPPRARRTGSSAGRTGSAASSRPPARRRAASP